MNRKRLVASAMLLSMAMGQTAALAAPATLHWSTFMRSGPGEAYPVLAELQHDEILDLGGCTGQWCKVSQGRTTGYVDRDALDLAQPPVGAAPQAGAACFVAGLTSYPGPTPRQFCETRKPPATSAR